MIDKLTRSKCIVLTYPTEDCLEATDIDLFIEGTTSIYEYTDFRLGKITHGLSLRSTTKSRLLSLLANHNRAAYFVLSKTFKKLK